MKRKKGLIRIVVTLCLWIILLIVIPNLRGPESNLDLEIITYAISILSLISIGFGTHQIVKKTRDN